jgi:hypothetical protein
MQLAVFGAGSRVGAYSVARADARRHRHVRYALHRQTVEGHAEAVRSSDIPTEIRLAERLEGVRLGCEALQLNLFEDF